MGKKLEVRDKKIIYLNGVPLIPDVFDYAYEVKNFRVAYNSNKLVIVDSEGNIIVSEEGNVEQVSGYGKCISFRKNNLVGVYHYDGSIIVPFEFHFVFIVDPDDLIFEIQKNKGEPWEQYELN